MTQCSKATLEFPKLFYQYLVGFFQLEFFVGPSHKSIQIGRQELAFWEDRHIALHIFAELPNQLFVSCSDILKIFVLVKRLHINDSMFVGEHFLPVFGTDNIQPHFGLEIRLVENWENSVRIVRLKLSIEVLFAININEANTSAAIVVVFVPIPNRNMVSTLLQILSLNQHEPLLRFPFSYLSLINHNRLDFLNLEVNGELVWHLGEVETNLSDS